MFTNKCESALNHGDHTLGMQDREVVIDGKEIVLRDEVETFFQKTVTKFSTSAKLDVLKKYIGKRAYVVILKD